MNKSIFTYINYKIYLKALIRNTPGYGHGFKSKIAKHLGCQTTYISQILNKDANFSLEQVEDLNELLGHSREESQFFRLLVQWERAGTVKLKNAIQYEIKEVLAKRELLRERVEKTDSLTDEQQRSLPRMSLEFDSADSGFLS